MARPKKRRSEVKTTTGVRLLPRTRKYLNARAKAAKLKPAGLAREIIEDWETRETGLPPPKPNRPKLGEYKQSLIDARNTPIEECSPDLFPKTERPKSHLLAIVDALSDFRERSIAEIMSTTGRGTPETTAARLREARGRGYEIETRNTPEGWRYRLRRPGAQVAAE